MKHIIFVAGLALALSYPAVYADNHDKQPETKKVCVDAQGKDGKPIMDPKTKKPIPNPNYKENIPSKTINKY